MPTFQMFSLFHLFLYDKKGQMCLSSSIARKHGPLPCLAAKEWKSWLTLHCLEGATNKIFASQLHDLGSIRTEALGPWGGRGSGCPAVSRALPDITAQLLAGQNSTCCCCWKNWMSQTVTSGGSEGRATTKVKWACCSKCYPVDL